jgi:hypothetical protein
MRVVTFAWTVLFSLCPGAAAVQDPEPIIIGEATTIRSQILGEEREILVSLPPAYEASTDRYPVLYLLDGPGHFHHATGTVAVLARSGAIPALIVVGIGNTDRMRDMTPTHDDRLPTSGGAEAFLRFIREELIPHVEGRYRTHSYRVLVGHSLAGLFTVHALTLAPQAFDAYVALSPTLEWGDEIAQANAERLFERKEPLDRTLFLALGDEGGWSLDAFDLFVSMLKSEAPPDLRWSHQFLKGDDHLTVVLRGTYHGLLAAFEGFRIPAAIMDHRDVEGLRRHLAECARRYGVGPRLPENLVNNLGYQALGQGKTDEAIEFFTMNVKAYPESANVYDSLGEAYEKSGRLDLAAENYAKAVERARTTGDDLLETFEENLARVTKAR